MGRLLLRISASIMVLAIALVAAVYYLILDTRPMVLPSPSLDGAAMVRVQRLLSTQRAQRAPEGIITVSLAQADIDTAVNYALQTSVPEQVEGLNVTLHQHQATLAGCLTLPITGQRRFINIRAELAPQGLKLGIERLQLGLITLPAMVTQWLERTALHMLYNNQKIPGLQTALAALQDISIDDGQLHITYRDQATAALTQGPSPPTLEGLNQQQVDSYLAQLQRLQRKTGAKGYPLVGILAPLFEHAAQRSASADTSAAAENTAAIAALALYSAETQLLDLAGLSERFNSPQPRLNLTIHRRTDLAKHFINSALIYLIAGNQVAELVGMQKELDDSDHGSGFSLSDLVADKAGIRFAELATRSAKSAAVLQRDAATLLYDDQLMPPPETLPSVRSGAQIKRMNESDSNRYLHEINQQVKPLLTPIALYRYQ